MERDMLLQEMQQKNLFCTGCGACRNICPVNAIEMKPDVLGFLQPQIRQEICIDCCACRDNCPVLNPRTTGNEKEPACYAVQGSDELRQVSSSGGAFTLFARVILQRGGVVIGAAMEPDLSVRHICIHTEAELAALRKSKYVQSDTGEIYRETKQQLDKGVPVLFSGTPCQVAGLYAFLNGTHENLYTIDILCHGVPSQKMLKQYLQELPADSAVTRLDFRPKEKGWNASPRMLRATDTANRTKLLSYEESEYEQGFHSNLILRNCCENCIFAEYPRQGDISLGDFWGIGDRDAALDDEGGTSAVLLNSGKGQELFRQIRQEVRLCKQVPLEWMCDNRVTAKREPNPYTAYFQFLMQQMNFTRAVKTVLSYHFSVGIVGPWMNINCGGALTYYALYETLRDMGYFPIMISQPEGLDWNPTPKYCRYKKLPYPAYALAPVKKNYGEQRELNNHCDTFLVGSDQLFTGEMMGLLDGYADLEWVEADKRKVAYAASFAYDTFQGTEQQKKRLRYFLSRFQSFSVREKSAVALARNDFDVEAEWVLDPVFLCALSHFEKMAENGRDRLLEKPYVFGYVLDPDHTKAEALHFAAKTLHAECTAASDVWNSPEKLKQMWDIPTLNELGNEEFVAQIQSCQFLLTDSFHGVCFAILFHRPFVAIANQERGKARFSSLLGLLGLEDHLLHDASELLTKPELMEKIDYAQVDERLALERIRCIAWLKQALEKPVAAKAPTDYDMACHYSDRTRSMIEKDVKRDTDGLNGRIDWLIGHVDHGTSDTDGKQWQQLEDHRQRLDGVDERLRQLEKRCEALEKYSLGYRMRKKGEDQ